MLNTKLIFLFLPLSKYWLKTVASFNANRIRFIFREIFCIYIAMIHLHGCHKQANDDAPTHTLLSLVTV